MHDKKIVSISGLIGSGKDTVSNFLVTKHGFKRYSFASPLKDAISSIFGWDRVLLEGLTPESRVWREQVDEWWAAKLNMPHLTPRWVLQYWGTNLFRDQFHDEIWIHSLERKLMQESGDVVITDVRFNNELNLIKKLGGITLRVKRGPEPAWYDHAVAVNKGSGTVGWAIGKDALFTRYKIHPSEYMSVGLDYDHVIDNNGTLSELHRKIDSIIDFQIASSPV